jgi:Domain of unknown function (DUF4384)
MSRTAAFLCSLAIGMLCAGTVTALMAQEDDNSRAVRIIDQPGGPSSPPPAPAPTPAAPAAIPPELAPPLPAVMPPAAAVPAPALPPVVATPPPATLTPAPAPPPAVAMPPPPTLTPAPPPPAVAMPPSPTRPPPATAMPPPAALPPALPPAAAMPPPSQLSPPPPSLPPAVAATPPRFLPKADNSAGVALDIQPSPEVQVGGKVTFRVSAKRPGYLILVDVDAAGRVTQIFPNRGSLLKIGSRENLNLIKPGRAMTIPEPGNAYAGFEFIAAPPTGTAMVVAILSDRPVQMLDLPDVPAEVAGRPEALNYIADAARGLRIASASESRGLLEARWSFDAKLYVVR